MENNTIKSLIESQKDFFATNKTKDIKFRKEQLSKFKTALKKNEKKLFEAIYKDFRKSEFETYETELALLYGEINLALKKINNWARRKKVRTNLANFPAKSYIFPEPYGTTLVIGAWNYPYLLSMNPVISAIAAGNTVILKPSEISANSSAVMAEIINTTFDEKLFHVVEGGVETNKFLLEQNWDYIFFTGSPYVGKIVYQAAAKNMTPVTLELGGKSPTIVFADSDLKMAAKRIVWGKFLNGGQTCIAPDYLLIEEKIADTFLDLIKSQIEQIYGSDFENNEAFTSIISKNHFERLKYFIDNSNVYYGGDTKSEINLIEPTILYPVSLEEKVMQEEIFGPILPVLTFKNIKEAIEIVRKFDKPLALYLFTKNSSIKKQILNELSFGGGAINDTILHLSNHKLPFGGVGNSGLGSYHGYEGFKTFSHFKSILDKPTWFEPFIKYPPYSENKRKLVKFFME
ncbi:MAG: aldehyde dehydrogenase [Bacteroidales bacterium]|nr:aldehyde dehydrogenase [Bacteroidales bacterium]